VRWRIQRVDGEPFALAGIWERRMGDSGPVHWSFAMLTINADFHPLMQRFHKPGDEKRSVTVLDPDHYEGWLHARTGADVRAFLALRRRDDDCRSGSAACPRQTAELARSAQRADGFRYRLRAPVRQAGDRSEEPA